MREIGEWDVLGKENFDWKGESKGKPEWIDESLFAYLRRHGWAGSFRKDKSADWQKIANRIFLKNMEIVR